MTRFWQRGGDDDLEATLRAARPVARDELVDSITREVERTTELEATRVSAPRSRRRSRSRRLVPVIGLAVLLMIGTSAAIAGRGGGNDGGGGHGRGHHKHHHHHHHHNPGHDQYHGGGDWCKPDRDGGDRTIRVSTAGQNWGGGHSGPCDDDDQGEDNDD